VAFEYDLGDNPLTADGYATVLGETFGADAPAVLDRYPVTDYPSPVLALSTVLTDWGGRIGSCPTLATAGAAARHAPVYAYELTEDTDPVGGFPFGAHHGSDVPYLFDVPWADPAPAGLSAAMVGYWTQFARHGDPNRADLPRWRPFHSGGTVLGLSGAAIEPTPFATDHQCALWAGR
jgi:para-nitrobenzyl esterase